MLRLSMQLRLSKLFINEGFTFLDFCWTRLE